MTGERERGRGRKNGPTPPTFDEKLPLNPRSSTNLKDDTSKDNQTVKSQRQGVPWKQQGEAPTCCVHGIF